MSYYFIEIILTFYNEDLFVYLRREDDKSFKITCTHNDIENKNAMHNEVFGTIDGSEI
jgi:hypothetical protein